MPSLSVTVVARNEERNLPRVLASVVGVADEVIVTDTGSTDATIDIARQFGARIGEFGWIDDFAAAHNYCKSLATGDWILMLDADEELLPASRDAIKALLADERVLAYHVVRQDLVDENRLDHFSEMWQTRLYRNVPQLNFTGRCHPHFAPDAAQVAKGLQLEVRESELRLRHYGYVTALRGEKNRRAARLLELELRDRPGQFYYLVELAATLLALGDAIGLERLAEAAQQVVDGDPQAAQRGAPLAMLLEHVLASPRLPEGFALSKARAREIALREFPDSVPLLWHIAREHYAGGQFALCAPLLERICSLAETRQYDRLISFDPALLGDDARLNLGVCWARLGQRKKAEACFRQLLGSPKLGQQAAQNLRAIGGARAY